MNQYKKLFPIFDKNPNLHYLDSAATALKPAQVILKMIEYYTEYSANIHRGLYPMSERATEEYEKVREKVARFIGAEFSNEIVFTRGTTESINMVAAGWGEANLKEGDEIVVSEIEHHSNMVPWQELAKKKKLNIKFWELNRSDVKLQELETVVTPKTKLVAITHASNVLGEINPVKEIIAKVRSIAPDAVVVVDGAQAVPHIPVNMVKMDADFYAFSGHKLYGPTGVGVLYGKAMRFLQMEPTCFGGGMIGEVHTSGATWAKGPEKFEAGTPPIAEVIGLGAAVDFVTSIGFEVIQKHEKELTNYMLAKLKELDWIKVLTLGDTERIGVVAFTADYGIGAHDVSDILGRNHSVAVRAGHHCTMPLHLKLGKEYGTVRASLGIYNTTEDIDELINGLRRAREIFKTIDEEMDYQGPTLTT